MENRTNRTPLADAGFEDRWNAWEARGAANDRTRRRTLVIIAAVLVLGASVLNALWALR